MVKVIGVRFRTAGKIYFFDPGALEIKRGDHVIVETARGIEYGTVVGDPREVDEKKVIQPLKPVLRIATQRDDEQEAGNKEKEKEAENCEQLKKLEQLFAGDSETRMKEAARQVEAWKQDYRRMA